MPAIKRLFVFLAGFIAASALGASYDFTAGTSSTNGWLPYTPLAPYGTVFTLSDGPGGYKLSSGVSTAPALIGPARIGSTLPLTVNKFSITFSVLNYTTANPEFFGATARLRNLGIGQTDGYVMGYDTSGELLISKIVNESSAGPISASAAAPVALTAGNSYQFAFTGVGSSFKGAVYNLGSSTPLATISGTDSSYSSGTVGLLVAGDTSSGIADATFGNFSVITVGPPLQAVPLTNGTLRLTWTAEPGQTYQLQFNSDLSSSHWTNLGSAVTATGATLSTTDSITNGPQRFYRVVLSP